MILIVATLLIGYWLYRRWRLVVLRRQIEANLHALVQLSDCAHLILEYSGTLKLILQTLIATKSEKLILFAIANKLIQPSDVFVAACSFGSMHILHWLLDTRLYTLQSSNSKNKSALHKACKYNHPHIVFFLLRMDIFSTQDLRCSDKYENCHLLTQACKNSHHQIVKHLLHTNAFTVFDIAKIDSGYWQNRDDYNVRKTCDILYKFCHDNLNCSEPNEIILTAILMAIFIHPKTPYHMLQDSVYTCLNNIKK